MEEWSSVKLCGVKPPSGVDQYPLTTFNLEKSFFWQSEGSNNVSYCCTSNRELSIQS